MVGSAIGLNQGLSSGPNAYDIGLVLIGNWALPKGFGIDYEVSLVNGTGANVGDNTPLKNIWVRGGTSYRNKRAANLVVTLGGGVAYLDNLNNPPNFRWAVDAMINTKYLFASFEYMSNKQFANPNLADPVTAKPAGETHAFGWALSGVGKTPWGFGPMVRYDVYKQTDAIPLDVKRRYTFGLYWQTHQWSAGGRCAAEWCPMLRLVANFEYDRSDFSVDPTFPQNSADNQIQIMAQSVF